MLNLECLIKMKNLDSDLETHPHRPLAEIKDEFFKSSSNIGELVSSIETAVFIKRYPNLKRALLMLYIKKPKYISVFFCSA